MGFEENEIKKLKQEYDDAISAMNVATDESIEAEYRYNEASYLVDKCWKKWAKAMEEWCTK